VTLALLRKELKVLWASPLPFVLGAVMNATLGVLGWSQITERGQAVFQPLVPIAGFLLVVVAPILASRVFADEIRSGTLELLIAIPVRRFPLVAGKYLAVLLTLLALAAPIGLFVLLLELYGSPDTGPVVAGLIGLGLLCAALSAVGVLTSSLTASQPVAAISGIFAVLLLWFAHTGSDALPTGAFLGAFSISERLRSFAGGLVDLGDVAFFVVLALGALSVASVAVESRRWR
jgi:gliding motility-associated transport system permease protein